MKNFVILLFIKLVIVMKFDIKSPLQSINKVYLKQSINKAKFNDFANNLLSLISNTNKEESEEHNKNVISDFLKNSFYSPDYYVNTSSNIDLAIHNGNTSNEPVAVIIEVKRPTNKTEMISLENMNAKALQELVLYYLEEKILNKNNQIKNLIATNIYDWYIFDAVNFERIFFRNNDLVNGFKQWKQHQFDNASTDYFYNNIAKPFIDNSDETLSVTHFPLREFFPNNSSKTLIGVQNNISEDFVIPIFQLFSPEHLLKKPFANDANSLNKEFYNELLYILGLEEQTDNGRKVINLFPKNKRLNGSIIENTIKMLKESERLSSFKDLSQFGNTEQEQLFSIALELVITWLNRILFLKLLEGQLLNYHNGDSKYKFLTKEKIADFDEMQELFFEVLAVPIKDRDNEIKNKYEVIPYLNSSLFDKTDLEKNILQINQLKDRYTIPIFSNSVLKDDTGKRISGEKNTLEYLFEFLDAYDFSSDGKGKIQETSKTIINASVLGLIFEKINGYKDGSFFTPSFITMYMAKEAIRNTIINKFNEKYSWNCNSFTDLHNFISARRNASDILEFNSIINSITICDPAVGSGHFLVSALNELIADKSELGILADNTGKILPIHVFVENDELIITDYESNIFNYNPKNIVSQLIQSAIFHEKQKLIENCLFGVDINPKSIYIARLRLWIELLKNSYYIKDSNELQTLPNLDINIKSGNSLISKYALNDSNFNTIKDVQNIKVYKDAVNKYKNAYAKDDKKKLLLFIDNFKNTFKGSLVTKSDKFFQLNKLKSDFQVKFESERLIPLNTNDAQNKKFDKDKQKLIQQIDLLQKEIADLENNNIFDNAFEWRFEFPEILNDNGDFLGFDIVIGNPPYINIANITDETYRSYIQANYNTVKNKSDLYSVFIEKAYYLSKKNAKICFIYPKTWMGSDSFSKFREFITNNFKIHNIVNLGYGIFEKATVSTIITLFSKLSVNSNGISLYQIEKNEKGEINFIEQENNLQYSQIKSTPQYLFSFTKPLSLNIKTLPLKELVDFSLGIKTSDDKKFIIDYKKDDSTYLMLRGKASENTNTTNQPNTSGINHI